MLTMCLIWYIYLIQYHVCFHFQRAYIKILWYLFWFSKTSVKISNCYRKLYTLNGSNYLFKENELNLSLGLCMVFIEKKNILNHYNCSMFNGGCPNSWYFSDEMYKCMYSLFWSNHCICYCNKPKIISWHLMFAW